MTAPTNVVACKGCGQRMPRVPGFPCCASCSYSPEWSKSSVGAGKVAADYEARRKRLKVVA